MNSEDVNFYKNQLPYSGNTVTTDYMYNTKPKHIKPPTSQFEIDLTKGRAKCTHCGIAQMLEGINKVEWQLSAKKFKQSHKCP